VSGESDRDRVVDDVLRRSRAGQSRATVAAASDACLDPETLALWVDDGLSAVERGKAERHVADCARCQSTLAALVRTAPVPERSTPWWQTLKAAWLAPLAAAAAALAIWIAVPGAPPSRSAEQSVPASARVEPAPQPATKEAQNAPVNSAPPAAARRDEKRLVDKPVAAPEQTQQSQTPAPEVAAASPALAAPAPTAPPSAAAPAPARPSVMSRAFAPAAADSAKSTALANAIAAEIVSPDSMSRWRITSGRIVEHTTDGGATWQEQPTAATLPPAFTLTAGSAPSASICWLVGQDGVVLLSSDGRTWRRVAFPETTALVAVRATDERTASVTDVNGRMYVTTDGGMRWTQSQ